MKLTTANEPLPRVDAEAIVLPVNTVGVLGKELAIAFQRVHPGNFKFYAAACDRHEVEIGRVLVYATGLNTNPRYLVNFPTKKLQRGKSRLDYIERGLEDLAAFVVKEGIRSIAFPELGCGPGGLAWGDVKALIVAAFEPIKNLDVMVCLHGWEE